MDPNSFFYDNNTDISIAKDDGAKVYDISADLEK